MTSTVKVDLPAEIFDVQTNVPLLHQVVVAQLAAARQGTHKTKTRAEVSGAGRKPFKQKGTGRARQGSIRAPHWRGGGVALGPKPRSYAQKTPKKMVRQALRAALWSGIEVPGVEPEYAEVLDPRTLEPVVRAEPGAVCAVIGILYGALVAIFGWQVMPYLLITIIAGFSLLELVIVCALISILVAIALVSFANRDQPARFQAEVASRIRERRASAIRINALTEATSLETFRQPPISIDFRNLQTTAALVVEGQADRTAFNPPVTPGTLGTWNFVYHGRELQIPTGWRIANSASDLSPLPLIPLGVPTTSFNFAADGRRRHLAISPAPKHPGTPAPKAPQAP